MAHSQLPLSSASYRAARNLAQLAEQVQHDLTRLNYPAENWVPPHLGPDGREILDVLIVGAGMCGQTVAFALMQLGVRNIRMIDRASEGSEGPWGTFARMNILRSPKQLTGPDLGIPSLTYRAWHEAKFGSDHWSKLHKIERLEWLNYLRWVRARSGVQVENHTSLVHLIPGDERLHAEVHRHVDTIGFGAAIEKIYARKVVLALGREGSGGLRWPLFASFDPRSRVLHGRVFHSADPIDFERWRGKHLAVLGAGASAFDNAAAALESGARKVELFVRRPTLPQVNKSKWTSFPGFMQGFHNLSDEQRWRVYCHIFDEQVPPPWESIVRCDRHPNFSLHLKNGWLDLNDGADAVYITSMTGEQKFDAAILATGFDVNLLERPELGALREHILLWSDRISEEDRLEHPEAARFPYLGDGFELLSRLPEAPATIGDVHLFNHGSTISHGALAGDIPGLATGARRVAQAIARDLFTADAEEHYQGLLAHDEPELLNTRFYVPPDDLQATGDNQ